MSDNSEIEDNEPLLIPPYYIGGGIHVRRWIENSDFIELIYVTGDRVYLRAAEIVSLAAYINTQNMGFEITVKSTPVIDGQ